jgi:hypothetical protein
MPVQLRKGVGAEIAQNHKWCSRFMTDCRDYRDARTIDAAGDNFLINPRGSSSDHTSADNQASTG